MKISYCGYCEVCFKNGGLQPVIFLKVSKNNNFEFICKVRAFYM